MTATPDLGAFEDLGVALGLLLPGNGSGPSFNPGWFDNPVTGSAVTPEPSTAHGLKHLMADPQQRQALLDFVDQVLGGPDQRTTGQATWVPLFVEPSADVTVYAVVQPRDGHVLLGVGVEHRLQADLTLATRVHVPIFRFDDRTPGPATAAAVPEWLALGRAGGDIEISCDATFVATAPPPGQPSLGGVAATVVIPTGGALPGFRVTLRDLQLPGTQAPQTFVLDGSDPTGVPSRVLDLVASLVRAQAEALTGDLGPFGYLAGLLGLRDVPGFPAEIGPLPLADLPTRGIAAITDWFESVLEHGDARDAWLGQLALLVDGTLVADRDAVEFTIGTTPVPVTVVLVGLRVEPGTTGRPRLTPWVEVSVQPRGTTVPVAARALLDLVTVDTATGQATAVPDARLEAVFGKAANNSPLIGTGSVRVDTVRTGVVLGPDRQPRFSLVAEGVRIGSAPARTVDLSTPEAALDAGQTVLRGVLEDLLNDLGAAGDLLAGLLGLTPPTVTGATLAPLDFVALAADPLAALASYYRQFVEHPPALKDLLADVRGLLGEAAAPPGDGTPGDPWRVGIAGPLALEVWVEAGAIVADVVLEVLTDDLGADTGDLLAGMQGHAGVRFRLTTVDPAARRATFASRAALAAGLRRSGTEPWRLAVTDDLALVSNGAAVEAVWTPTGGLTGALRSPGLALIVAGRVVACPLPRIGADGRLTLPEPDWTQVEDALAALAARVGSPIVAEVVGLLGWGGPGDRLSLDALLTGSAAQREQAVLTWLADVVVDCGHVREALRPVATLLSGGEIDAPLGSGHPDDPFRCPIAGDPSAPALRVWLDPGCPRREAGMQADHDIADADSTARIVARLHAQAPLVPDLADLLVGRPSLDQGFDELVAFWRDTDGLTPPVGTLPTGVVPETVAGASYDELRALGAIGLLTPLQGRDPAQVVHVGCETDWLAGRERVRDLSADVPPVIDPMTGAGPWFVRLPEPGQAARLRPDRGAVGEQAARLVQALEGRTTPVTLVGYGAAGAAVVRAAGALTAARVSRVVTVGAPWSATPTAILTGGLGGDALEFLGRLSPTGLQRWPDALLAWECTPAERVRLLVGRGLRIAHGETTPSVAPEPLPAGIDVHAVFGGVEEAALVVGIAGLAASGAAARREAREELLEGPGTDAATDPEVEQTALHVGIDLPVFDLDLGGLLVGVGGSLEVLRVERDASATEPGPALTTLRTLVLDIHFGLHDAWLVGGPGVSTAVDLRWMSARIELPLEPDAAGTPGVAAPGRVRLTLHEARSLGVDRERWVVEVDAGSAASVEGAVEGALEGALPEVRRLLSQVIARLAPPPPPGAEESPLGRVLTALGLLRDRGLDENALLQLLHDPVAFVRSRLATDAAALAAGLRAVIPSSTGAGTAVGWSASGVAVSVDLATGRLAATYTAPAELDVPLTAAVTVLPGLPGSDGVRLGLQAALGDLDRGQLAVELAEAPGSRPILHLARRTQVARAGQPAPEPRRARIWPDPDGAALADAALAMLPAWAGEALARAVLAAIPPTGRAALTSALTLAGLVRLDADEVPVLRVPALAVTDPVGWWLSVHQETGFDPLATAVALLDAFAPLVAPDRGTTPGWPITDDVTFDYAVEASRLRLSLTGTHETDVDGHTVSVDVTAGLLVSTTAPPVPHVSLLVDVDGLGLRLTLDPLPRLAVVRPGRDDLLLYPTTVGIGDLFAGVAESVVPQVLNAVAGLRTSSDAVKAGVGTLVADLGDVLRLRQGTVFRANLIAAFAADPALALRNAAPGLAALAVDNLAPLLAGASDFVAADSPGGDPAVCWLGLGAVADGNRPVTLTLDARTAGLPVLTLTARAEIPEVGEVVLEELRLTTAGIGVQARIGPIPVDVAGLTLRPLLTVRAGTTFATPSLTRMAAIGLAFDDAADRSVEVRWGLDASPPQLLEVRRTGSPATSDGVPALLSLGVSMVGTLLGTALEGALDATTFARIVDALEGVVLEDGATTFAVDDGFVTDLLDAARLLARAERLLYNAATMDLKVRITPPGGSASGPQLEIGLAHDEEDGLVGLRLTTTADVTLVEGDLTVALAVDPGWINPEKDPGLTIWAIEVTRTPGTGTTPDRYSFEFAPGFLIAGVGVRFQGGAGPLVALGPLTLDGLAVFTYAEVTPTGDLGGGVLLELTGLAIAPAAGGGNNQVANSIVSDAGAAASPSARPTFSPGLSVQQHPGDTGPRVGLRAGPPPGPWWLLVQRQLGPLYLGRIGLDVLESGGRIQEISVMLDGRVSLFGLVAEVEGLSLTWVSGGDFFDAQSWKVDLAGLAVSADMGGVVLAGGLLKSEFIFNGRTVVGYTGMLLGRFAVYGLSVFGGYADLGGTPSFFVFGAFNGPIGGPPAFFLTGIGGGFGINRRLHVPDDPAQFNTYPFIQALDPAAEVPEPMAQLKKLNDLFGPQVGNFWFAAGISFTCFSLVDGIAVIAVSFGDGLEINLLGLARLALPDEAAALVSIELGLLARFSTKEGLFMIRAGLTDNSWLLYRDVRLTGGFAFVVWWKGPNAGQFVMTIGGYHPDFHRDGYPEVQRVGLTWQVTSQIVIKGGSYFALTSEALMAGVGVRVSADFGWAWVLIVFEADGLVYFDPFRFKVRVFASISAGIEIDTWLFGTVSISVTLSAELVVEGPEFRGRARFEVGPCTLEVPFGNHADQSTPLQPWDGFVAKYLEAADATTARCLTSLTGHGTLPSATGGQQSAPSPDGSATLPYEVYAEFELTVTASVPVTAVQAGLSQPVTSVVRRSDGTAATPGLKPMGLSDLRSELVLTLHRKQGSAWVAASDRLPLLTENLARTTPDPLGSRLTRGHFPLGVWGTPDPPNTQSPALPEGEVIEAATQAVLVARANRPPPGPEIEYRKVRAGRRPLPLSTRGGQRTTMLNRGAGVSVPAPATTAEALTAAADLLFPLTGAGARDTVAAGPLPVGRRSRLSRAAYVRDTTAPPQFGTLTDGLASLPDEPVEATVSRTRRTRGRTPQPPRVVGLMTAGAHAAARPAGTTVTDVLAALDKQGTHRPAPTTTSVAARLGRTLPVRLLSADQPAGVVGGTATPVALPRTVLATPGRAYGFDSLEAAAHIGGLAGDLGGAIGIRPKSATAPVLAAGDVIALDLPDHSIDLGERRPSLTVTGSARVVSVAGNGRVLADAVHTGQVVVPPGTALLGVQADGDCEPDEGLAGWHARSQVAAIGGGAALAAGCTLTTATSEPATGVGWTAADRLVEEATEVVTTFAFPVTTLALVIDADGEDVGPMDLRLVGAERRTDTDGRAVDPQVIVNGDQTVAVYDVVPETGSPTVVAVALGGGWRLTGVLGSRRARREVVDAMLRHGVVGATARLQSVGGPGATVTWSDPQVAPKKTRPKSGKKAGKKAISKTAKGGRRGRR